MAGGLVEVRRQHVIVGLVAALLFAAVMTLTGWTPELWVDVPDPKADSLLWRFSVSAADTSVALLAATLLFGPIRVMRGHRPAVHRPWRRVLGIWTGIMALLHVSAAVFVHARWQKFWSNWLEIAPPTLVGGDRGLANWLGLAQVAIVILLLWLSRDAAVRRLGGGTWKWLQRSTYVLALLVAAHALLYHRIEERITEHRIPIIAVLVVILVGQLAGVGTVLLRRRSDAVESE
jgi:DMSO/TMAO reductase YedYZ heme-binding membrane subunit